MTRGEGICRSGGYGRPSSYDVWDSECSLLCATPTTTPWFCSRVVTFYCSDGTLWGRARFHATASCDTSARDHVLRISPLEAEPQSASIIRSIEPGKTTDTLLAKVVNKRTNEIIPNVDIKLELTVKENSGGHIHAEHNPIVTTNVKGSLRSDDSQSIGDDRIFGILEGNTGDQGLQFTYEAPPPAGDIVVTGSCISHYCKQDGADTIWVGIKGLQQIVPSKNFYEFVDCHQKHTGGCHHLTRNARDQLSILTRKVTGALFGTKLYIGDASLERGGLFDIGGDWTIPAGNHYAQHDRGKAVDIYVGALEELHPTGGYYLLSFMVIAKNLGMEARHIKFQNPDPLNPIFKPIYFHVHIWREG